MSCLAQLSSVIFFFKFATLTCEHVAVDLGARLAEHRLKASGGIATVPGAVPGLVWDETRLWLFRHAAFVAEKFIF